MGEVYAAKGTQNEAAVTFSVLDVFMGFSLKWVLGSGVSRGEYDLLCG